MNVTTIGLDIAKNVFHVHGVDEHGKFVVREKLSRRKVLEWFAKSSAVPHRHRSMSGGHYWARELLKLGHSVKLMLAQYVKAYVRGNKNDGNDTKAICEAVSRPGMRFVAINTEAAVSGPPSPERCWPAIGYTGRIGRSNRFAPDREAFESRRIRLKQTTDCEGEETRDGKTG